MSKYEKGIIYEGSIIKDGNVIEENVLLLYDEKSDTFLNYTNVLNCMLDLELHEDNLSSDDKKRDYETIEENRYEHGLELNGKIYVDDKTIRKASFYENKKKRGNAK